MLKTMKFHRVFKVKRMEFFFLEIFELHQKWNLQNVNFLGGGLVLVLFFQVIL